MLLPNPSLLSACEHEKLLRCPGGAWAHALQRQRQQPQPGAFKEHLQMAAGWSQPLLLSSSLLALPSLPALQARL